MWQNNVLYYWPQNYPENEVNIGAYIAPDYYYEDPANGQHLQQPGTDLFYHGPTYNGLYKAPNNVHNTQQNLYTPNVQPYPEFQHIASSGGQVLNEPAPNEVTKSAFEANLET